MTPLERWRALYAYLQAKLADRDWHGVRDVTVDIEVLEAQHPELKSAKP